MEHVKEVEAQLAGALATVADQHRRLTEAGTGARGAPAGATGESSPAGAAAAAAAAAGGNDAQAGAEATLAAAAALERSAALAQAQAQEVARLEAKCAQDAAELAKLRREVARLTDVATIDYKRQLEDMARRKAEAEMQAKIDADALRELELQLIAAQRNLNKKM